MIKNQLLFSIYLFCSFLCACTVKKDFDIDKISSSSVALTTPSGQYLCADRNDNNFIYSNRKSIGAWEKFEVDYNREHEAIQIKSSDGSYIGVDSSNNNVLRAGFFKENKATYFGYSLSKPNLIALKDFKSRPVQEDNRSLLRSQTQSLGVPTIFGIEFVAPPPKNHFSLSENILFGLGICFLILSIFLFFKDKRQIWILISLFIGAFLIRLFVVVIVDYLYVWDEQFHALVAKNLMNAPLKPTLYKNPVLPYDPNSWTSNHIWLHKQPLFLWQIALSLKIFGLHIWAVKLPSAILSSISALFIFRIGQLSVGKTPGILAALFFATSAFTVELVAGGINTEHNDVAFMFYITASIWAWLEYERSHSKNKLWFLLAIGIFSGAAILTKWLTGLLVFSGWGLAILLQKERRNHLKSYLHLLISFSVAVVVFLPWQIYTLVAYPNESNHEYAYNTRHFYEVIEGHGGDFLFHFDVSKQMFGIHPLLLILSFIICISRIKLKSVRIGIATFIVIIYTFFTIAATKMPAFTYCIAGLSFLSIGTAVYIGYKSLEKIFLGKKKRKILVGLGLTTLVVSLLVNIDYEFFRSKHSMWQKDIYSFYHRRLTKTQIIKSLNKKYDNLDEMVIVNTRHEDPVNVMFLTPAVAAYNGIPSSEDIETIKKAGHKILIFDDNQLPEYIHKDSSIIKHYGYWP